MGRAAHLMVSTITYSAPTARTGFAADPSFSSQSTAPAYVETVEKEVLDIDGRRVKSTHLVITEADLVRGSRVWTPDDDTAVSSEGRTIVSRKEVSSPRDAYRLYEYRLA